VLPERRRELLALAEQPPEPDRRPGPLALRRWEKLEQLPQVVQVALQP
jgi:hypothetical protein